MKNRSGLCSYKKMLQWISGGYTGKWNLTWLSAEYPVGRGQPSLLCPSSEWAVSLGNGLGICKSFVETANEILCRAQSKEC